MLVREGAFAAQTFTPTPREVLGLSSVPILFRSDEREKKNRKPVREGGTCKTAVKRFHSSCV